MEAHGKADRMGAMKDSIYEYISLANREIGLELISQNKYRSKKLYLSNAIKCLIVCDLIQLNCAAYSIDLVAINAEALPKGITINT